ncbi:MAG TPA: ATP-binding cassette domain-containing protein, partial [Firmicutes bacterium]|nr:ATP-binding cassette domain-containing protein [Bacillota bacterium]
MVTAADGGQGPAVRASAVCKVYADGTRALDGIDLEIEQGEFVFLLGKSGAGKTTFLRLLLGEEPPSHGQLWVYGHPFGAGPPLGGGPPRGGDLPHGGGQSLQRLRRVLGPVFQDLRLVQGRTALDNVALGLWILGLPPAEIGRRAHEALAKVGLGDKAGHRVETLSTGEQQRV